MSEHRPSSVSEDRNIRPARVFDCEALARIAEVSLHEPWRKEDLEKAVEDPNAFVAALQRDETPIGFLVTYFAGGEGELLNIAVLPEARKKGYGDALLSALFEEAKSRGTECIFLEVRQSNAAALHLYEKHGFARAGVRKGFYDEPREDAVVMRKDFVYA